MRNLYELRNKLSDKSKTVKQEAKRIKKLRVRLIPWFLGVVIFALFALSVARVNSDYQKANADLTNQTKLDQKDIKALQEKYQELLKLQKSQKDELEKKINQVSAKKEAIRLASVQSSRPRPVQQPNVGGTCEQYRPLVAQYPWNVEVALAVMKAESGCNPNATHLNSNGSVDHGLFQLNNINVHDPAENVRLAYEWKYAPHGWQPWTVCTNGIVKCS